MPDSESPSADVPLAAAGRAKNFITLNSAATLSTLSQAHGMYPFGSVVPYDIEESGALVIFISRISEHYKNLVADGRASIFVVDSFGLRDPQAHSRATILTRFAPVAENEQEAVSKRYFARFPDASGRSLVHDFVFFRGEPERIRWIGGFGEIRWVEAEKFRAAPFDPVSYLGMGMIEHMNDDHADALRRIAAAAGHGVQESELKMVSIDRGGFRVAARKGKKESLVEIRFPQAVTTPDEVRRAIIALVPPATP